MITSERQIGVAMSVVVLLCSCPPRPPAPVIENELGLWVFTILEPGEDVRTAAVNLLGTGMATLPSPPPGGVNSAFEGVITWVPEADSFVMIDSVLGGDVKFFTGFIDTPTSMAGSWGIDQDGVGNDIVLGSWAANKLP